MAHDVRGHGRDTTRRSFLARAPRARANCRSRLGLMRRTDRPAASKALPPPLVAAARLEPNGGEEQSAQPPDQRAPACLVVGDREACALRQQQHVKPVLPTRRFHRSTALSSSRPFLADAGSGPGNCAGMEETTGAPSSFAALSPRRLRASSRDGGGVVNRPPSPLTILLSHIQGGERSSQCSPAPQPAWGAADLRHTLSPPLDGPPVVGLLAAAARDLATAVDKIVGERVSALVVLADPLFAAERARVARSASERCYECPRPHDARVPDSTARSIVMRGRSGEGCRSAGGSKAATPASRSAAATATPSGSVGRRWSWSRSDPTSSCQPAA